MKKQTKKDQGQMTAIEREIEQIYSSLKSLPRTGMVIEKKEMSKSGVSCKARIDIYEKADINRMLSDSSYKARPVESYVFYPGSSDTSRLGSVAIYGKNAFGRCMVINAQGSFMGKKVIKASVELGLRPFVDVTFAA